jgi:hypothetical protein|tara:strand:- start:3 stop:194 length:192 start_codon:yes stop_codon:yes gene_type:complete
MMINIANMELYDIYIKGSLEFKSITEEEMEDKVQELADDYYKEGFPHPDEIEVRYLGHEDDPQ